MIEPNLVQDHRLVERNMIRKCFFIVFVILIATHVSTQASAQEKDSSPPTAAPEAKAEATPSADATAEGAAEATKPAAQPLSPEAEKAKAAFEAKFDEYKASIRAIETLQADFQTANEEQRKKLNSELSGQVAHAQGQVNAMVEAAMEAYRTAPNSDPRVTDLLVAVARHYTIGRQIGPGSASLDGNPHDVYYPIDGGDQYEKALPIVKLLIDNGATEKQLYAWGFLCAFMTNDFDLTRQYFEKAQETGSFQAVGEVAAKDEKEESQAGLMKSVAQLIDVSASELDNYAEYWKKESALREAEAKADDLPRVKLTTNKGEIVIELFENEAPQTVASFLSLVKQGFYDKTPFHRVLPKFMAQGGDPTGTGTGGPGYSLRSEAGLPNHRQHFRGTLSMARSSDPDSAGSQFFLTFVATPSLNGQYTAFGRVIEGIEVLGEIQRRSPSHQENPPEADRVLKAEVLRDRGHKYEFERLPEK